MYLLIGKAGSGKDTVADTLGYPKYSFAGNLKELLRLAQDDMESAIKFLAEISRHTELSHNPMLFEDGVYLLEEVHNKKLQGKQRENLQLLGNGMRELDPFVWIKALWCQIQKDDIEKFVVTDCRFINEFNEFNKCCVSIFVDCTHSNRLERLKERDTFVNDKLLSDISETELDSLKDKCDYVINNNGDLVNLKKQVDEIIRLTERLV